LSASDTLSSIFAEFARRRKDEKVSAWMFLQTALAENAGILCPSVVSLKDLIAATANVEDLLKGQSGEKGISPSEYLAGWLNSADDKATQ
jgi:hypothetical protein